MIKNIEDLVRVNKELKDRNEELELNMLSNALNDWYGFVSLILLIVQF